MKGKVCTQKVKRVSTYCRQPQKKYKLIQYLLCHQKNDLHQVEILRSKSEKQLIS